MKKITFGLCILFAFVVLFKSIGYAEMYLDSNGNVGVGTSNPSAKLDVLTSSGNAVIGESTTNGVGLYGISLGGYAGYFQGDARVTGNLTVDGLLTGPGIGDVTGVTAGAGLSGGGTSGDIMLNADITYLQRRVSSSCLEGSSIRTINTDGTVVCEPDNGSGGITEEFDPTVLSSVKDGVNWTEVTNRPSGLDDGDDVGITSEIDPKIGSNTINYVPKWDGSSLISGTIYENNNGNLGIGLSGPKAKLHLYSIEGIGDPVFINDAHMLRLESRGTPSVPLNTIQVIKSYYSGESEIRFDNDNDMLAAVYTFSNDRSLNFLVGGIYDGGQYSYVTFENIDSVGDMKVHLRAESTNESALVFDNIADPHVTQYVSKIYRPSNSNDLVVNLNGRGDVMTFDSLAGNIGIGTVSPQSKLQIEGYVQLALASGLPPSSDCNEASERGRMKVDSSAGLLYICVDSGWIAK